MHYDMEVRGKECGLKKNTDIVVSLMPVSEIDGIYCQPIFFSDSNRLYYVDKIVTNYCRKNLNYVNNEFLITNHFK